MRWVASFFAMCAACGLPRGEAAVTEDVLAHLRDRYGEDFVLTRVTNRSNAGTGLVDVHRFEGHPVADPATTFSGTADYRGSTTTFSDTLRCARAAPAVRDRAADALRAAGFGVPRVDLRCTDARLAIQASAPPSPDAFHWQGPIVIAAEPGAIAQATARAEAVLRAAGVGSSAPSWRLVDPALGPHLGGLRAADDLSAWELGRPLLDQDGWQIVMPSGPLPRVADELATSLREGLPDETDLHVRAAPGDAPTRAAWAADPDRALGAMPPDANIYLDIRAHTQGAEPADLAPGLRDRALALVPRARVFVYVARWEMADGAPTFREGAACTSRQPCIRVAAPLIEPPPGSAPARATLTPH